MPDSIIEDMKQYYAAPAAEYDEWFDRKGRYDHGPEANARWHADALTVDKELIDFGLGGDILELAAGTGIWTKKLSEIPAVKTITAVDASPEMLHLNQSKVASDKVDYVKADLFQWKSSLEYDGIFFGFWLSHVPTDKLDHFLRTVASALKPGGKIFFLDSRPDQTMSAKNHKLPEPGSEIMNRVLNDGRSFNIVKNFFDPVKLKEQCGIAGLDVTVKESPYYFIFGMGIKTKI